MQCKCESLLTSEVSAKAGATAKNGTAVTALFMSKAAMRITGERVVFTQVDTAGVALRDDGAKAETAACSERV